MAALRAVLGRGVIDTKMTSLVVERERTRRLHPPTHNFPNYSKSGKLSNTTRAALRAVLGIGKS